MWDLRLNDPFYEWTKERSAKNPSIFNLFFEAFSRQCIESSANGLPLIFKTNKRCIRFYWTVLFLTSCGAGSYCIN